MKRSLLLLLLLMALVAGVFPVKPVAAACADIDLEYSPMQMYAPAILQITFQFTKNRNGDWKPVGLATGASIEKGTDFLRFRANENDTYHVWFAALYDTTVQQNVTLIIQEGSRPPISLPLCMNGTSIYILWNAITVIPEPQYPSTPDIWAYGNTVITGAIGGLSTNIQGIYNQNWVTQGILVVIVIVLIALVYEVRSLKQRGRSYV